MPLRVGINGFGRIGRSVCRILSDRDDIEVVAINDLYENQQLAYLLKYDTVMGVLDKDVTVEGDFMFVDGDRIAMIDEMDPAKLPWAELGVDIVVESTGVFRLGVNDQDLDPADRIVSNASCTTNCLAPIAKILDDAFGIEEGFLTTVHAYTNDQRLADVPHKDRRRSRAAAENIIPTTTGAARAVGKVLPHLDGKLDGLAMRVPVPDGSLVDFVCRLAATPSREEINMAVREAAEGPMKKVVEYSEVPLVSSDIIGNPHSSIFDALSTATQDGGFAKVVSWYDNEWGYSNRVVDLMERLMEIDG